MAKCQLEYAQSGRADTVPCDKPAVGVCADCGTLDLFQLPLIVLRGFILRAML
jgi:hypothetical protein